MNLVLMQRCRGGGYWPPKFLADQLTLVKTRGQIIPITLLPLIFSTKFAKYLLVLVSLKPIFVWESRCAKKAKITIYLLLHDEVSEIIFIKKVAHQCSFLCWTFVEFYEALKTKSLFSLVVDEGVMYFLKP